MTSSGDMADRADPAQPTHDTSPSAGPTDSSACRSEREESRGEGDGKTYYSLGIFTTTDSGGRVRLSHPGIFDAASGNGLVLEIGPRRVTLPLSHWNGDTLAMEHVLEFKMAGEKSLVHFDVGAGGKATTLEIDLLNANGLGAFTR